MLRTFALTSFLVLFTASTTLALDFPMGPRVGYTSYNDINQIHFGAHAKLGELFPNVEMTPNVELGLGDDFVIVALNGDLAYKFTELTTDPWGLYGGGSLSMNFIDSDHTEGNLDLGLNALVGVTRKLDNLNEVLAEIRVGVLDSPDLKITIGYTFF